MPTARRSLLLLSLAGATLLGGLGGPSWIGTLLVPAAGAQSLAGLAVPVNDPGFGQQWALQNTGQTVVGIPGTSGDDIGATGAWQQSLGAGAVVAVVDTGIDYHAPDLAGQTVAGYNFVAENSHPQDRNGHGTFVSSIIAAIQNNGVGVSGVAPAAKIMPLQAVSETGVATSANLAAAFNYAGAHQVRIVNASLAAPLPSPAEAAAIRAYPNTLFVVAAGNDASDNDRTPSYPCDYPYPNIICVGASDSNDGLARFSNYGATTVSLFAPGLNILSTTLSALTDPGCSLKAPCPQDVYESGTSMATPMVAGTFALMLAANPALSAAQLKAALLANTTPVPALADLSASGGVLDACCPRCQGGSTVSDHSSHHPHYPADSSSDSGSAHLDAPASLPPHSLHLPLSRPGLRRRQHATTFHSLLARRSHYHPFASRSRSLPHCRLG